jgi:hypothetical protein
MAMNDCARPTCSLSINLQRDILLREPEGIPVLVALILASLLTQESKKFPVQGTDLMNGAEITGGTKVAQNYKIEKSGKMVISPLPDKMQTGSYQVKVYVMPISPGAVFDFQKKVDGKLMSWPVELVAGKWKVKTGDGKEFTIPAQLNKWAEIVYEVIDESKTEKGVTESKRTLRILIDGKPILAGGQHTGDLTGFSFTTNDDGAFVIGGVDLVQAIKVKR